MPGHRMAMPKAGSTHATAVDAFMAALRHPFHAEAQASLKQWVARP